MYIRGFDQLRKHIPDLNSPLGVIRTFLLAVTLFFLVTTFFNTQKRTQPFWLLVAEIVLGGLGFLLLYLFIRYRKGFKARFGNLAYNRAASMLAFPGVAIIAAVLARIRYLPGPEIPRFRGFIVLPGLGYVLIALGVLLFMRTLQTFGIDNLIMLYVYFPEESQLVNHRIYNILRHPAYASAQYIALGLALINGNWFAIACVLLFALGLWVWVRLVEEKELIERFGPAYDEYRQRVPAFWPRLTGLRGFFGFLITGR